MNPLSKRLESSPMLVRLAPFALFVALTVSQGHFGESSRYWCYLMKTVLGAWMIWIVRPFVPEMKWAFSKEATIVGVLVFIIWVGMNPWYPKLGEPGNPWNPHAAFGPGSVLAWTFISVRILGSTLVVPVIEEIFYRSFLYRYLIKPEFQDVPLGRFHGYSFIITSILFGVSHHEWLAGIACGLIYQGLVCRKNRLGDAISAHAITNFLLGCWVVWKGAWNFW